MDKPAKGKVCDDAFKNHCFPVFHGVTPVNEGEEESSCQLFRPSFDVDREKNGYRPASILSSQPEPDQHDVTDERRQESYNAGIIAGQKDGHCLVQDEMMPGLQKFALAEIQFNEQLQHISEVSVRNVLELASGIVHKVIGEEISLNDEDLTSIGRQIREAMHHAYAINMRMNAEDFESLSAMVQCSPDLTLGGDAMHLTGDGHVQKGSLHYDTAETEISFESIDQALSRIFDRTPST